jgi:hypothetical protein
MFKIKFLYNSKFKNNGSIEYSILQKEPFNITNEKNENSENLY